MELSAKGIGPKSGADRTRLHRIREKQKQVQIAVGVSKLVLGQGTGEQRRAIIELLEKVSSEKDLDERYAQILDRAIDSLNSQRR